MTGHIPFPCRGISHADMRDDIQIGPVRVRTLG